MLGCGSGDIMDEADTILSGGVTKPETAGASETDNKFPILFLSLRRKFKSTLCWPADLDIVPLAFSV